MTNYNQYCLEKTKASKSSFYFSFRFLNKSPRQAITAIYAFCREVDDIVDDCNNKEVAFEKIQWWRKEIENIFTNQASHPIALAIIEAKSSHIIKKQHLLDMLDGMIMDLKYNSYDTIVDLEKYCYCVASTVGLMLTDIFGYTDNKTLIYAKNMGLALQLVNIIRDVGEDARRERLYIPLESLQKFSIQPTEILNLMDEKDQRFIALMEYETNRAYTLYEKSLSYLSNVDRATQLPGLIMAKIYFTLLKEIQIAKYPVLHHKISLTSIRKIWLAYTTYRKEKKLIKKNLKISLANG